MELLLASTYIRSSTTTGLKEYFAAVAGRELPGDLQLADVGALDLAERGVLGGIGAAGIVAPGLVCLTEGGGRYQAGTDE